MGNEQYKRNRSNLVVHLKAAEEDINYTRNGDNLIYTHTISLRESLNCDPILFTTLDGR